MFKWLLTGLILYLFYRYFIVRPSIDRTGRERPEDSRREEKAARPLDDEEYTDYEEVK